MSQDIELIKNNPKALLFATLNQVASYQEHIQNIDGIAKQYDKEALLDPKNAAVSMTASKAILEQYNSLMNLEIKEKERGNSNVIDYADNEEFDELIKAIPQYLPQKD